jgi:hypothetical protein
MALKWMRALTDHRVPGDERVLLSLPAEERTLLKRMIAAEEQKRRLRALWSHAPDFPADLPTD